MFELDLVNTGLKTTAMLFIVLGLIVLVIYLMKRFMSPMGKAKGDLLIKVVSSLHLSPKERVDVIEISGERIVLGIAPGSINFLTKLDHLNESRDNLNTNGKEYEFNG